MRGVPPFWQLHTIDPPTPWEDWREMFPLASIARENIDIDTLLNPLEFLNPEILQLEEELQNESTTAKTERFARNAEERNRFRDSENVRIKLETKTFNGKRMEDADKKIGSMLYLALGGEDKRFFSQKFSKVKIPRITFTESWDFLTQAFIRKT